MLIRYLAFLNLYEIAVYRAVRSKESEKAARDLNWIGGDISSDRAHNFEHFGHFILPIFVANWQFLIKV